MPEMPETTEIYLSATLKPATAELVVRDPLSRARLSMDGERKPLDTYWCRRLADGDVVVVEQPAAAAGKPAGKAPLKVA